MQLCNHIQRSWDFIYRGLEERIFGRALFNAFESIKMILITAMQISILYHSEM